MFRQTIEVQAAQQSNDSDCSRHCLADVQAMASHATSNMALHRQDDYPSKPVKVSPCTVSFLAQQKAQGRVMPLARILCFVFECLGALFW